MFFFKENFITQLRFSIHSTANISKRLIFGKSNLITRSIEELAEKILLVQYRLVTNDYETDETFPGAWFIAKYVLERDMDRSLEFSTAEWLLEHDHEELALKVEKLDDYLMI